MMMINAAISCKDSEIQAHNECLFRFAVWRVQNETTARDLVQETFLAAVQARNGFRGESCLQTWLVGILRHKISDYYRERSRQRPLLMEGASGIVDGEPCNIPAQWPPEVEDARHSPSRRLELTEFRSALDSALSKLPRITAKVFQLYEIEGEPSTSVCMQLQISHANLWIMLHRARKKLSAELSCWRMDGP